MNGFHCKQQEIQPTVPYTNEVYFPPKVKQSRAKMLLSDILKDPGSWLSNLSLWFILVVTENLLPLQARRRKNEEQRTLSCHLKWEFYLYPNG